MPRYCSDLFLLGDVEVLFDLPSYMQTIVSTQRTEFLLLEMKHFERLLLKRHPTSIESMKSSLEIKLKSRHSQLLIRNVPLLKSLLEIARTFNAQRQLKSQGRTTEQIKAAKPGKFSKAATDKFDSFIPSRGALVDIYGHGTVFHRIRERDKYARKKRITTKPNGIQSTENIPGADLAMHNQERPETAKSLSSSENGLFPPPGSGSLVYRKRDTDPALTDLENRMREWLNKDFKSIGGRHSTMNSKTAQVVKISCLSNLCTLCHKELFISIHRN